MDTFDRVMVAHPIVPALRAYVPARRPGGHPGGEVSYLDPALRYAGSGHRQGLSEQVPEFTAGLLDAWPVTGELPVVRVDDAPGMLAVHVGRWGGSRIRCCGRAAGQGDTGRLRRVWEDVEVCELAFSWPAVAPGRGRVVLREFRADDAGDIDAVVQLSNDPYVPKVTSLVAGATRQEATEWIHRQTGRLAEGVGFSFAIADSETDRMLGQIGLWLKDVRDGRASAGYAVTHLARGHGVAVDALLALTDFAWTLPPVHRVELYIEPWNTASIRTAERARYDREGLLRSHQEIGGIRRDMLLYAAIRPDEAARP